MFDNILVKWHIYAHMGCSCYTVYKTFFSFSTFTFWVIKMIDKCLLVVHGRIIFQWGTIECNVSHVSSIYQSILHTISSVKAYQHHHNTKNTQQTKYSMEALEGHCWVSTYRFILLFSYDFWFMTFDLWLLIFDLWILLLSHVLAL
jgi:hypothetical protein